jgi:hypothetical protein
VTAPARVWKAHCDWRGMDVEYLERELAADRANWPGLTFTGNQLPGDRGIGVDVTSASRDALRLYLDEEELNDEIVEVRPPGGALATCEHFECAKVLNIAAWLLAGEGGGKFADLAVADASLNRFSRDCGTTTAVVYLKNPADREWFMLPVSRVTDPRLLAQLEVAAEEAEQDGGTR